ncbi:MAG: hypothetical protein ACOX6T_17460 [Myxococcales bacterium]|jgi:hypothetical protein
MRRAFLLLALGALAACQKVPLTDIHAGFTLADATWFAQEQTLFVFYRAQAEQGFGPETQLELSYLTDEIEVPWTPLAQISPVHTHEPVDCGPNGRCGSISLHVEKVPRRVRLQLRYHFDGEMTLPAEVNLNVVGEGPPHKSRSLIVYGVFDETNTRVQWRARHQFPALRNQEVQELGLRRFVRISEQRYGDLLWIPEDNPYGYGVGSAWTGRLVPLDWPAIEMTERAVFDTHALPLSASAFSAVCARATVTDALGEFDGVAIARKNPEVRPAFPVLHSPIRENVAIGYLLKPCGRTISEDHREMQKQRLLLDEPIEVCIDGWTDASAAGAFASAVRAKVDEVRARGDDMVLTVALHHDDQSGQVGALLEQALEAVLELERDKSSPRVSGAFVFDSYGYEITRPAVGRLVLWCPARVDEDPELPTTSMHACPLQPDMPDLELGPFRFNQLPILPTRETYLGFIDRYSKYQAGRMLEWHFLAPERTPQSVNLPLGDFGVATFFNNELISAQPTDAFSFCAPGGSDDPEDDDALRASAVFFRGALVPDPIPLAMLPEYHMLAPQGSYPLGIGWDFPFLARAKYVSSVAGAVTAFSFSIPFGIGDEAESYYGTALWDGSDFELSKTLLQCTRFCDHPTFDSAGVYNVLADFRTSYASQCYRPRYPTPADGGFPLDP